MALTKFKLVNHEKLKGLNYQGDLIKFDDIDDELAEKLHGKTHVLERLPDSKPAAPAALAAPSEEGEKKNA